MTRFWKTVPVEPDTRMRIAFAAEIRRQAALLPPGTTAHEPLEPLWAAVLAVAPTAPPPIAAAAAMPRTGAEGWNAAVTTMVEIASHSASRIAATSKRHVHEDFAVAALTELAASGRALLLPTDPPAAAATAGDPVPNPTPAPASQTAEASNG